MNMRKGEDVDAVLARYNAEHAEWRGRVRCERRTEPPPAPLEPRRRVETDYRATEGILMKGATIKLHWESPSTLVAWVKPDVGPGFSMRREIGQTRAEFVIQVKERLRGEGRLPSDRQRGVRYRSLQPAPLESTASAAPAATAASGVPTSRPQLRDRVRVYWPKHARTYCGVVVNVETALSLGDEASYRFQLPVPSG